MTIEEIKELLEVFNDSGVAEMELQRGENRLRLRRSCVNQEYVVSMPAGASGTDSHPQPVTSAAPAHFGGHASTATATPKVSEIDSGHVLVKSPIVGTYYDAPAPGAPPFVRVGDAVEPGQVLCIIESMKLMNEIECEVAGIVAAKLVENGRPVEYGEALFAIRPR
jgi:acetyl-CoA carboxylase biotin carboxyl carrier protein